MFGTERRFAGAHEVRPDPESIPFVNGQPVNQAPPPNGLNWASCIKVGTMLFGTCASLSLSAATFLGKTRPLTYFSGVGFSFTTVVLGYGTWSAYDQEALWSATKIRAYNEGISPDVSILQIPARRLVKVALGLLATAGGCCVVGAIVNGAFGLYPLDAVPFSLTTAGLLATAHTNFRTEQSLYLNGEIRASLTRKLETLTTAQTANQTILTNTTRELRDTERQLEVLKNTLRSEHPPGEPDDSLYETKLDMQGAISERPDDQEKPTPSSPPLLEVGSPRSDEEP